MKRSLLQLPNETLARIAQLCQEQDRRYTERYRSLRAVEEARELLDSSRKLNASLHELSRTCQKIRAVCAPLIFSTVEIKRVTSSVFCRRIVPLYAAHFRAVQLDHPFGDKAAPSSVLDALAVLESLKDIREIAVNESFIASVCPVPFKDFANWISSADEAATSLRVLMCRTERLLSTISSPDILFGLLSLKIQLQTLELNKRMPYKIGSVDHVIERIGNLTCLRQLSLEGAWVNHLSKQLHQPIGSLRCLTLVKSSPLDQDNMEFITLFAPTLETLRIQVRYELRDNFEGLPLFTSPFPQLRRLHVYNSTALVLSSSPSFLPSLQLLSITAPSRLLGELISKLQQYLRGLEGLVNIELAASSAERYRETYARDEFLDESFELASSRLQDSASGRSILFDDFEQAQVEEEGDGAEGDEAAGEEYIRRRARPLRDVLQFGLEMEKALAKSGDVLKMEQLVQAARPFLIHPTFSYFTLSSWIPDPFFRIRVKAIHRARHGSDTGVYDSQGRFVSAKFEQIFEKFDKSKKGGLTFFEGLGMIRENRNVLDPIGWIGAFFEWFASYLLIWPKNGIVMKEDLRTIYDGSIFYSVANKESTVRKRDHHFYSGLFKENRASQDNKKIQ